MGLLLLLEGMTAFVEILTRHPGSAGTLGLIFLLIGVSGLVSIFRSKFYDN